MTSFHPLFVQAHSVLITSPRPRRLSRFVSHVPSLTFSSSVPARAPLSPTAPCTILSRRHTIPQLSLPHTFIHIRLHEYRLPSQAAQHRRERFFSAPPVVGLLFACDHTCHINLYPRFFFSPTTSPLYLLPFHSWFGNHSLTPMLAFARICSRSYNQPDRYAQP